MVTLPTFSFKNIHARKAAKFNIPISLGIHGLFTVFKRSNKVVVNNKLNGKELVKIYCSRISGCDDDVRTNMPSDWIGFTKKTLFIPVETDARYLENYHWLAR